MTIITDFGDVIASIRAMARVETEYFKDNGLQVMTDYAVLENGVTPYSLDAHIFQRLHIEGPEDTHLEAETVLKRFHGWAAENLDKKSPDNRSAVTIRNWVAYEGYKTGALDSSDVLMPKATRLLDAFGDKGIYTITIAHPRTVSMILEQSGYQHLIESYLSHSMGSKKTGKAFQMFQRMTGEDLSTCLYIDDKDIQVTGALGAGIGRAFYVPARPDPNAQNRAYTLEQVIPEVMQYA